MKKLFLFFSLVFFAIWSVQAYTSNQFLAAKNLWERWVIVKQWSLQLYRLDETMTRKEFMKILANQLWDNIENECDYEFADVKNDWWCKYIEWAMKNSYVAQDTYFRPNEAMTKAEAMKLILKARDIARVQKTSDWRTDDMQTAYQKWIISSDYSDYDTSATRWWIFEALATEQWQFLTENTSPETNTGFYVIGRHKFQKDILICVN